MATNVQLIEQLYVAYFRRPADVAGLEFWESNLRGGTSLQDIRDAFASQAEYQASYAGMTAEQRVDAVYLNLFGHHADDAGRKFYADALTSGATSIGNIVADISQGAQGADLNVFSVKTAVAELFTSALTLELTARLQYSSGSDHAVKVGQDLLDAALAPNLSANNLLQLVATAVSDLTGMVPSGAVQIVGISNADLTGAFHGY